jgi:hypothetical protein
MYKIRCIKETVNYYNNKKTIKYGEIFYTTKYDFNYGINITTKPP